MFCFYVYFCFMPECIMMYYDIDDFYKAIDSYLLRPIDILRRKTLYLT